MIRKASSVAGFLARLYKGIISLENASSIVCTQFPLFLSSVDTVNFLSLSRQEIHEIVLRQGEAGREG